MDRSTGSQEYLARLLRLAMQAEIYLPPTGHDLPQVTLASVSVPVAAGQATNAIGSSNLRRLLVVQNDPGSTFNISINFGAQAFVGGLVLVPGAAIGWDIPGTVPTNAAFAVGDPAGVGTAQVNIITA